MPIQTGTKKTTTEQAPGLSISIVSTETPEANVPLVWCINKAMLEHLKAQGAVNPQVLISICNVNGKQVAETMRYLEPATLGTKYISFSRPGKNIVSAAIVWDPAGDTKRLKNKLLSRRAYDYTYELYDYHSTDFAGDLDYMVPSHKTLEVSVPDTMFAKEPPKWLKQYIMKFVRGNAFDQCHFRRRAMFAVPSMIVVVPAILFYRCLMVALLSVIGLVRGLSLKPLLHPFSMTTGQIWSGIDEDDLSMWVHKKGKNRWGEPAFVKRQFPFWIINPPVILLSSLILFIVSSWHITTSDGVIEPLLGWSYLQCLAVCALGAVALVTAIALVIGFCVVAIASFDWVLDRIVPNNDNSMTFKERRVDAQRARRQQAIQQAKVQAPKRLTALTGMVCGDGPKPTNPQHSTKESIELWFDRTKHKVCRPFAR